MPPFAAYARLPPNDSVSYTQSASEGVEVRKTKPIDHTDKTEQQQHNGHLVLPGPPQAQAVPPPRMPGRDPRRIGPVHEQVASRADRKPKSDDGDPGRQMHGGHQAKGQPERPPVRDRAVLAPTLMAEPFDAIRGVAANGGAGHQKPCGEAEMRKHGGRRKQSKRQSGESMSIARHAWTISPDHRDARRET